MDDFKKILDEYSPEYCHYLECTYGDHMLSEGGTLAVDKMFENTPLNHRKLLDIGSGLGGVAFYLADHYQADVTGLELNSWMVQEASRRIPTHLHEKLKFVEYQHPPLLPFSDQSFDVVYSKGVLVHVHDKIPLFKEIFRVLKPTGSLVIHDWLSPTQNQWGERLEKMCEIENLTLYPDTENQYHHLLQQSGFSNIQMRDENRNYFQYNEDIVNRLITPTIRASFSAEFGETAWQQAVEGYQLIADSIRDNELLIRWFKALRPIEISMGRKV